MAEIVAFHVVVVLFVAMVAGPLAGRALGLLSGGPVAHGARGVATGTATQFSQTMALLLPAIPPRTVPFTTVSHVASSLIDPTPDPALDPALDPVRVEGRVRASAGRKIEEIVSNHPDETLAILRGWMN